jgi:hypothetical protein
MSAGRHQEVGQTATKGQPANFTLYKNIQMKNRRTNRNLLRETQKPPAHRAEADFLRWLNAALRDERWRAVIHARFMAEELAEIEF